GVVIYSIGVGTAAGEPIPLRDEKRNINGYKKDEDGSVVVSRLDEASLRQISSTTGGQYYRATAGEEEVEKIYQAVSGMDKKEFESKVYLTYVDRFQIPLGIALFFIFIESLISDVKPVRQRDSWLASLLLCLLIFTLAAGQIWRDKVSRKNSEGNALYEQRNYPGALDKYVEANDGKAHRQELSYNLANTLYQQKKYREALQELEKAIVSDNPGLNQKAYFNRGNAFFQMGKYAEAIESYKKALELSPGDREAKHNLELALKKLQENPQEQQKDSKKQNKQQDQDSSKQDQKQSNPSDQQKQQPFQPKDKQNQPQNDSSKPQQDQKRPQLGLQPQKPGLDPKEALRILDALNQQEKQEQRKQALKIQRQ
ncbi:MAG: tetratricopeptide repeat protein, partial [Acidobacteria bacterium]|nr:tetratricopeptide repeat protein [Acidobacteriota bacterium]